MDTTTTTPPFPSPTDMPAPHAAPPPAPSPAPTRRKLGAGHIVALVVGCLLLLPGLGMAVGGGFALVGQAVATDDDGYFEFTLDRIETDGVAIAATDIWLDGDSGDADWLLDWLDVDVRLRVGGAQTTDDVFVGIGRTADVARYLAGTSHTTIVEVDGRSPRSRTVSGTPAVESPLDQDFWTAQAAGAGVQELSWEAKGGRWSVVVMNADGSPVVAADVDVALKSGAFVPIAVTLLAAGVLVTITAVVLIVVGARGRRRPGEPENGERVTTPLSPPSLDTAAAEPPSGSTPMG